jgi:hypothetical protein
VELIVAYVKLLGRGGWVAIVNIVSSFKTPAGFHHGWISIFPGDNLVGLKTAVGFYHGGIPILAAFTPSRHGKGDGTDDQDNEQNQFFHGNNSSLLAEYQENKCFYNNVK